MPMELYAKVEEIMDMGKWNNNQMMNIILDAFFEIIEADGDSPKLPLVTETLRELKQRSRK
ncbi:MAG: hypothetical protein VB980_02875 [Opitutales bacterium]